MAREGSARHGKPGGGLGVLGDGLWRWRGAAAVARAPVRRSRARLGRSCDGKILARHQEGAQEGGEEEEAKKSSGDPLVSSELKKYGRGDLQLRRGNWRASRHNPMGF